MIITNVILQVPGQMHFFSGRLRLRLLEPAKAVRFVFFKGCEVIFTIKLTLVIFIASNASPIAPT